MQLDADKNHTVQRIESGGVAATATSHPAGITDNAALAGLDMGLFKALRKLDTPKSRICSAMWLSYAEYDELSKLA
ncbi:MAG: hypothetical protein V7746_19860 [Halioglobus sp.]